MTVRSTRETYPVKETLDGGRSYLDLVEQLGDIDDSDVIEARDALSQEMAMSPERYLPQQFEELGMLYRERSDHQRYDWFRHTEEVAMFVSRTPDCEHIEEQYAIIDTFSPRLRHWQHTTYAVKVIRHASPSYVIKYDGQTAVEVLTWDDRAERWETTDVDRSNTMLADFFYESLRATAMQLARTPEERQAADNDAKRQLETMLYGGEKVTTASE